MKISSIILEETNIQVWDEYSDDYDPWIAAEQAETIARDSGIRISRDKELKFIVINNNDDVIGALWASLESDGEANIYDFDVAVSKENRNARIGLHLIEAAMDEFQNYAAEDPNTYIRVWVVNPRLVKVLENKYGFDIESEYKDGSAHMVYYG